MKKYEKPSEDKIKEMLSPEEFAVTQKSGTERPFANKYWDNHEEGIYVDVVSGEPLFSSRDKFDSGTGWPSFTKPIEDTNVKKKADRSLFGTRTEVRSKSGDSHLGHVFDDGPSDKGGMRFCINSAALKFVPVSKLRENGYEEYLALFKTEMK
jgi:methionine-R-sulfoxide reductase